MKVKRAIVCVIVFSSCFHSLFSVRQNKYDTCKKNIKLCCESSCGFIKMIFAHFKEKIFSKNKYSGLHIPEAFSSSDELESSSEKPKDESYYYRGIISNKKIVDDDYEREKSEEKSDFKPKKTSSKKNDSDRELEGFMDKYLK
ncbi:hypothetical protein ACFLYA_02305 [Candidatus Dependentiae bacterium]